MCFIFLILFFKQFLILKIKSKTDSNNFFLVKETNIIKNIKKIYLDYMSLKGKLNRSLITLYDVTYHFKLYLKN